MTTTRLSKLMIASLVVVLLFSDVAVLPPASRLRHVHAAAPGPNVIVGFFRTFGALQRRNRVYREAGATAEEVNAYYDRLITQTQNIRREYISQAASGATNPRFVRSYVRIEAALAAERAAAIEMIEAEKNQARRDFNRTLGKEIANILIASPGGQQIIGKVRETIEGARDAAVAVQIAVNDGRPIDALQEALVRQVGDIPIAQEAARELGSVVGHGLDKALGGALSKVEKAIDDIQGEMGQAIDLLDQLDTTVANYDEQERKPVSLVEDGNLISELVPVERANAAVDVAASAYAGASKLAGALEPGTSQADMRDRIRDALLNERVEEIRGAVSGDTLGQTYCSSVGRGQYEAAARQLGQTPQNPRDPEKVTYLVCYDIQSQAPIYARMFGATGPAEETSTPPPANPEAPIPVGTYQGTTEYPQVLGLVFNPGEYPINEVTIHVAEDGTVTGSLSVFYKSGIFVREDNDCTGHWEVNVNGSFSGTLTGEQGTIDLTENWACVLIATCEDTGQCQQEPIHRQIDIQVSGDQMTGTTRPHPEDPDGIMTWSFTAARQ